MVALLSAFDVDRLGWTLLHTLWQFALIAMAAMTLDRAMRGRSAVARYWALLLALAATAIAPLATWWLLPSAAPASATAVDAETAVCSRRTAAAADTEIVAPSNRGATPAVPFSFTAWRSALEERIWPWLAEIVGVWFAGVLVFSLRPMWSWHSVRRLRTVGVSAVPASVQGQLDRMVLSLRLRRPVEILQSALVNVPVVVGCVRPAILLPLRMVTGLPALQLEAILAHELAHVRRRDFQVNVAQTLLETAFFYHPAVWWLSGRIRRERENCCDDLAVAALGNRVEYGRALLAVEALRGSAPALALGARGSSLPARIQRLFGHEPAERTFGGGLVMVGLLILACVMSTVWATTRATAQGPAKETSATSFADALARRIAFVRQLQGTWLEVEQEQDGRRGAIERHLFTLTFSENAYGFRQGAAESYSSGTVSVANAAARLPQLDFRRTYLNSLDDPRQSETEQVERAIASLDGDSLVICWGGRQADDRPADLTTTPDDGRLLMAFRRLSPLPLTTGELQAAFAAPLGDPEGADGAGGQSKPATETTPQDADLGKPAPHSEDTVNHPAGDEASPLERTVSFSANELPLQEALAGICQAAGIPLELDVPALAKAGLDLDARVTADIRDEPLQDALSRMIDWPAYRGVFRELRSGKLLISTIDAVQERVQPQLPDWLRLVYNRGLLATLDDDRQVVSVTAGEVVTDELLAKLTTLPKLRELYVEVTRSITSAGLAHLAKMPALEKLTLYECGLTDAGAMALESMTQLERLSLRGNGLSDAAMLPVSRLTNLKSLNLESVNTVYYGPMRITDQGLRLLAGLTELEELGAAGLPLSGNGLAFPKLKSLTLGGMLVTDDAMPEIARCSDLRYLRLSYTRVSDRGLRHVASFRELVTLSLDSAVVTDEGIAHLKALPNLRHMELRASHVSDESLKHLSQVKSLRRLDLYGSGLPGVNPGKCFSIAGMQQLKELPKLRTLWLTNVDTDGVYLGLKELTQLRELSLMMANITEDEITALEDALPNTVINVMSGHDRLPKKRRGSRPAR